jgi:hypothetical protein
MSNSAFSRDGLRAAVPLRETERGRTERRLIDALAEYGVLPAGRSPLRYPAAGPCLLVAIDRGPGFASGD